MHKILGPLNSISQRFPFRLGDSLLIDILLTCLCFASVFLHSSLHRPIWIDEFLHFALGSHQSTADAWNSISKTVVSFNHGQTGIYMIIDYWLLQLFGASSFWLRFPSLVSGFLLLVFCLYIFRVWKMSIFWQIVGILALCSQSTLMYFAGEARPYMPLVAATVGTLAYYSTPWAKRKKLKVACLGLFSIGMGTLFHPYFSVYWLAICLFTYFQQLAESKEESSITVFVKHCNLKFSIIGIFLYFFLGYFTWLRGRPDFSFDPFEWTKNVGIAKTFFTFSHLQFLQGFAYPFLGLLIFIAITIICIPQKRLILIPLIAPITLLIISFLISILLSLVSFLQDYWILFRQWVASIALSTLAIVWFAQRFSKILGQLHKSIEVLWIIIFLIPVLISTHKVLTTNLPQLLSLEQANVEKKAFVLSEKVTQTPTNNDEWVDLANANISQGGKVWPVFRAFYAKRIE